MITTKKLSKSYGSKKLFEDVDVTFSPGKRYGLTGPNGAGKSTFMKVLMGYEEPSSGTVTLPHRVGILRQNIEDYRDFKVIDTVIMGNRRLWDAMTERDSLYEMEMNDEVGMRLGDLEGIIAEENGYAADSDAEIFLSGMGIPHEYLSQTMKTIPTDMQFRVLLCQALFGEPQALLLDEPTNHLDMESIGWLENFMLSYKGTLIVISHDRHFLNSVCTCIADIDYETIITYPGNYDDMIFAKSAVRERAESDAKSKEKKIAQLKEFVSKFGAGTRASQVQSRVKEMAKLRPQELKKSNIQRPYIRFIPTEKAPGQIVLKATDLAKSYDDLKVIDRFSLEVARGDKIGVIGANGRGKSTLLKMLAKVLTPDRGHVEVGHQAIINYFPQNHAEIIDKKDEKNAFEWLKARVNVTYDQEIRSALGKMLFGGDDAFKAVGTLSGGETARLIMASMMLCNHNVIIMDEPNNHLDLEAVSALAWGLEEYKGTAIVASHDRNLLEGFATKIVALEENKIHIFDGALDEYLAYKSKH